MARERDNKISRKMRRLRKNEGAQERGRMSKMKWRIPDFYLEERGRANRDTMAGAERMGGGILN